MFLELVAIFAAGAGAAGLVLAVNVITGGRLPRWAMPLAAGAAMLFVAIWNEQTWGSRTVDGLPDGAVVVQVIDKSVWWRPWTYFAPQVTRLIVADGSNIRSNPDAPDVRLVELYLFQRWRPVNQVGQFVRCTDPPARADVTAEGMADPDAIAWRPLEPGDGLAAAACSGEAQTTDG